MAKDSVSNIDLQWFAEGDEPEKVEITFDQVKSYLEANKDSDEVKGFISSIAPKSTLTVSAVPARGRRQLSFRKLWTRCGALTRTCGNERHPP